jgi:phosphoribosylaminoimidazole-succinocarboxamide synthase
MHWANARFAVLRFPKDLKENDKLPEPIITPTTKASVGHDEDISREDILAKGIVTEADYVQLENTRQLVCPRYRNCGATGINIG